MGRGRDGDVGRPVDPRTARAYGNDPDAVEVHRAGGSGTGYGGERQRVEGLGPDIHASGSSGGRSREEEVFVSRGSSGTGSATGVGRAAEGGSPGGGGRAPAPRGHLPW